MEIGSREDAPFALFARFQRADYPARGARGGMNGAAGAVRLASGAQLKSKGTQLVPAGDRLIVEMPGGGGLGSPAERPIKQVADDLENEFISAACARDIYQVVVASDLSIDAAETEQLRRARTAATASRRA